MLSRELPSGVLLTDGIISNAEVELACRIERFTSETGQQPSLVIVSPDSGHDGSAKYMRSKQKVGNRLGAKVEIKESGELSELHDIIQASNTNPSVHGIIVQVPLAESIRDHTDEVVAAVAPEKDVDGLGPESDEIPATARAIDSFLDHYRIDYHEHDITLVGLGKLANGPLLELWRTNGAGDNVTGIDLNTLPPERRAAINSAQVIISATGQPGLLTPDLFTPDTPKKVLVDVGTAGTAKTNKVSQHGDISDDLREFAITAGWGITPEIRGIGAITVRALFSNLMTAAEKQAGLLVPMTSTQLAIRSTSAHPLKGISGYADNDRIRNPYYFPEATTR